MEPLEKSGFFALLALLASAVLCHINGQVMYEDPGKFDFEFDSPPTISGRQVSSQMAAESKSDAAEKEAQTKVAAVMDFKHMHPEKVSLVYNVTQVELEVIISKTDVYYCHKYGELHALCALKHNRFGMQYYRRGLNITQMEFIMMYVTAVRHRLLSGREKNKVGIILPQPTWMYKIQWSQELQVFAQRISNQCRGQLNTSLIMRTDSFKKLTTNIAITADTTSDPRWTMALNGWYSSISKVTSDAIYVPGKGMDSYTAMAWGKTGYIGCGYAACRGNLKDQRVKVYTCVFGPGGNKPGKPIYPKDPDPTPSLGASGTTPGILVPLTIPGITGATTPSGPEGPSNGTTTTPEVDGTMGGVIDPDPTTEPTELTPSTGGTGGPFLTPGISTGTNDSSTTAVTESTPFTVLPETSATTAPGTNTTKPILPPLGFTESSSSGRPSDQTTAGSPTSATAVPTTVPTKDPRTPPDNTNIVTITPGPTGTPTSDKPGDNTNIVTITPGPTRLPKIPSGPPSSNTGEMAKTTKSEGFRTETTAWYLTNIEPVTFPSTTPPPYTHSKTKPPGQTSPSTTKLTSTTTTSTPSTTPTTLTTECVENSNEWIEDCGPNGTTPFPNPWPKLNVPTWVNPNG